MNDFVLQHEALPQLAFLAGFILLWAATSFVSGWRSLARRYRTEEPFPEHMRRMQNARMRSVQYNRVITAGSDAEGIYLGMMFLFRIGYPSLFIPWTDIKIEEPKQWFIFTVQTWRLGPDATPVMIRVKLSNYLLAQRGSNGLVQQKYSLGK